MTALVAVTAPGDQLARPRCYRINSNYRTLCGQWNDAPQCTDWGQITCPACREVRQRRLDATHPGPR